jgi:hypothetical protein
MLALKDDHDLSELVFPLCVAELRRLGLPERGVTAVGDQNAAEGGVDVLVALARTTNASSSLFSDLASSPGSPFRFREREDCIAARCSGGVLLTGNRARQRREVLRQTCGKRLSADCGTLHFAQTQAIGSESQEHLRQRIT